ncbi:unnamed protein product [Lepidochelys olivacea]
MGCFSSFLSRWGLCFQTFLHKPKRQKPRARGEFMHRSQVHWNLCGSRGGATTSTCPCSTSSSKAPPPWPGQKPDPGHGKEPPRDLSSLDGSYHGASWREEEQGADPRGEGAVREGSKYSLCPGPQ